MTKRECLAVLSAVLLTMLVGCQAPGSEDASHTATPPRQSLPTPTQVAATPAPFTVATLMTAFRDAGLESTLRAAEGRNLFGLKSDDVVLSIGARHVSVYVAASEAIVRKTVSGLRKHDPFPLVEFIGRPHVFARGRLIVLFVEARGRALGQPLVGRDERIFAVLEGAMGAQVAGR